jgi:proline dehydrogenase
MPVVRTLIERLLPLVPRRIVAAMARRYVAGPSQEDLLAVARLLEADGYAVTADLLGENASDREEVRGVVEEYLGLLVRFHRAGIDPHVSIKLTHLGLRFDEELAFESSRRIVARACECGGFVQIDMEDSSTTDAALRTFRRLRGEYECVGLAIQAYLRRSAADVRSLAPLRPNLRICKGIYSEPPTVAMQDRASVRESFLRLLDLTLESGGYPAIATHDPYLVDRALERLRGFACRAHEFQMLAGVGHALRPRIRAAGSSLRIYLPYGPDWYDYSLRRLRENPRLVGHVVRGLLSGRALTARY